MLVFVSRHKLLIGCAISLLIAAAVAFGLNDKKSGSYKESLFSPENWRAQVDGYAAYAVGETEGIGWVNAHNTAEAARANAMAFCMTQNDGCEIVEERANLVSVPESDLLVSQRLKTYFTDYMTKPGPKAFVSTDSGVFYYAYGYNDLDESIARAKDGCEAEKQAGPVANVPDWPCKVVHTAD